MRTEVLVVGVQLYRSEPGVAVVPGNQVIAATPAPSGSATRASSRLAGLRRRLARLRGDRKPGSTVDDASDVRLELMLLREENMRLLSDRHRPFDLGTLIDQLRLRMGAIREVTSDDEAWSLLGEYLLLRENLDLAMAELDAAIGHVRARLPFGAHEPETSSGVSVADAA
jgi:hypothetical protein